MREEGLISEQSAIFYVDDGSRDKTWPLIQELSATHKEVCGIKLSRNRGHQNALFCGLMTAPGDALISVDADLQDDLDVIPQMVLVFAGLLLCLLVVLWLRAADLLYALFFGMLPFPGFDHILVQLLTTPRGWALILTGSAIGGLFAAFAMAISLFSIPMLLERRVDALTALGTSFAITTQNLRSVLPWGVIVTLGFALSAATGLLGLIVIFPLLGHGTWHAWRAIDREAL